MLSKVCGRRSKGSVGKRARTVTRGCNGMLNVSLPQYRSEFFDAFRLWLCVAVRTGRWSFLLSSKCTWQGATLTAKSKHDTLGCSGSEGWRQDTKIYGLIEWLTDRLQGREQQPGLERRGVTGEWRQRWNVEPDRGHSQTLLTFCLRSAKGCFGGCAAAQACTKFFTVDAQDFLAVLSALKHFIVVTASHFVKASEAGFASVQLHPFALSRSIL